MHPEINRQLARFELEDRLRTAGLARLARRAPVRPRRTRRRTAALLPALHPSPRTP